MTNQDRRLTDEGGDQFRQDHLGFLVHVIRWAGAIESLRPTVAMTGVDEAPAAGLETDPFGKFSPQLNGTQALVEKNERGLSRR
jgi:hypothetical protein